MITSFFPLLVVLGFLFMMLSAWGARAGALNLGAVAWTCWFIASLIWAFGGIAL